MKRFLTACALGLLTFTALSASAQIRHRYEILDDGAGNFLTIQAPAGMTGPLTWTAPIPPAGNPASGFLNVGTVTGQLPWWDNSGTGQWSKSTNLVWDNTNNRLAIGATSTTFNLGVTGTTGLTADDAIASHDSKQLLIRGASDNNQQLEIGYYTATALPYTAGHGAIQAYLQGTGATPLLLQPAGGNIGIGSAFTSAVPTHTLDVGGTLAASGNVNFDGNVTLGNASSDAVTVTGTVAGASPLVFDGATAADGKTTTFAITDPTAPRTITFPDATGTVSLLSASGTTNTVVKFTSSSAMGNSALTDDGSTLTYTAATALTNSSAQGMQIAQGTSGTAASGFGSHLSYSLENAAGSQNEAARIGAYWTNANAGVETSTLGFVTENAGTLTTRMTLDGSGNLDVDGALSSGTSNAFQVSTAGAITGTALDAGTGTIQTTGAINGGSTTISGTASFNGTVNLGNANTDNINFNGVAATALDLNSHVLSNATTIGASGNITTTGGALITGNASAGHVKIGDGAKFVDVVAQTGNLLADRTYTIPTAPDANASFAITTGGGYAVFSGPTTTHTYTLPNTDATLFTSANGVAYGGSNNTLAVNTTKLFDVSYAGGVADGTLAGARIVTTPNATTATNGSTALTLTANANASGTATGLSVSAAGGSTTNAIDITGGTLKSVGAITTSGNISTTSTGSITSANGLTVNNNAVSGGTTVLNRSGNASGTTIPATLAVADVANNTGGVSTKTAASITSTSPASSWQGANYGLQFTVSGANQGNYDIGGTGGSWNMTSAGTLTAVDVTAPTVQAADNTGAGSALTVRAGNGSTTGGALTVNGGDGAAGAGGDVTILGGNGSTTDGAVNINTTLTGATSIGNSTGTLTLTGSNAALSSAGVLSLAGNQSPDITTTTQTGANTGNRLYIQAGTGGPTGHGADLYVAPGYGGAVGQTGGSFYIQSSPDVSANLATRVSVGPSGDFATAGPTFTSTVGDNAASVFKVQEGSNSYVAVTTTNGSENVTLGNATTNPSFTLAGTGKLTTGGATVLGSGHATQATTAIPNNVTVYTVDDDAGTAAPFTLTLPSAGTDGQVLYFINKDADDTATIGSDTYTTGHGGTYVYFHTAGWTRVSSF